MKCHICNGTGKERNYFGTIIGVCPKCNGTGEAQPMTNEEYIRTCSTEELAILLCNELFIVEVPNPSLACRYRNKLFQSFPLNPMDAYQEVMRWLREKHMITLKSCPFEEPTGEYKIENDKKPITNEEWFCSLSTEEKAKVIIEESMRDSLITKRYYEKLKGELTEWLKQPHREEAR